MAEDFLNKFNNLPDQLQQLVSSSEAVAVIEEIERKYDILLAAFVMKIMTKDIPLELIGSHIMKEFSKNASDATNIAKDLIDKVFKPALGYLIPQVEQTAVETKALSAEKGKSKEDAVHTLTKDKSLKKVKVENPNPSTEDVKKSIELHDQVEKSGIAGKKATLIFHEEDEKEIEEFKNNSLSPDTTKISQKDSEAFVDDLIIEFELPIQNEKQKKKFHNLVDSRFKGIRDDLELHDMLIRPREVGGMDFNTALAEAIVGKIKNFVKFRINQEKERGLPSTRRENQVKLPKETVVSPIELPLGEAPEPKMHSETLERVFHTMQAEEKKEEDESAHIPQPALQKKFNPLTEGWSQTQTQLKSLKNKDSVSKKAPSVLPGVNINQEEREMNVKRPQVTGGPVIPILRREETKKEILPPEITPAFRKTNIDSEQDKPHITDIKAPRRTLGPIEELLEFKVKDLRQLSPDPKQVMQMLKGKLDLLEEDSIGKKAQGIQAWKSSEVNDLYLAIGQESLIQEKSIDTIIQERQKNNMSYLTPEEFASVADFNRSLRF